MNYNKRLDDFYDTVYKPYMKQQGDILDDSEFGIDGLLNRPAGTVGGEESRLWDDSPLKILLLLKDINANDSYTDSRRYEKVRGNIGRNIAAWIYAIHKMYIDKKVPSIEEAYNKENQRDAFQNKPFAIVNIKKKVGKSTVKDKCIKEYAYKYAEKIRKEIDILHPNIILCCGGSKGLITKLAKNIYSEYSFEQKGINGLVYYCNKKNILLLRTCHPSIRRKKEFVFCNVMNDLKEFFDNNTFP